MLTTALMLLALAQAPENCEPGKPFNCAESLDTGDKAGFSGILVTPALAAELYVTRESQPKKIQLAVTATAAWWGVKLDAEKDRRRVDNEAAEKREKKLTEHYEQRLDDVRPSWYERPWFVATVATVGTLAAVALSIEVLRLEIRR